MLMYFLIFLIPAYFAYINIKMNTFIWILFGFIFSIIIGFRFEVGGDWAHYLKAFENIHFKNYYDILIDEDPGYYLLNLSMYDLGFGVFSVNFICAIIFMIGLMKLAKQEFNPWMVIAVAVPYTVMVVAMGYTRQAVALGFIMWAITYLKNNRMIWFFIFVFLAATFHKSAVLVIGLGIFANGGNKFTKIIAVSAIGVGLYSTFLASHAGDLVRNYVDAQMQSSGAFIRTFMNLIPAILLLVYRKRWKEFFNDFSFWFIIAILSIVSFAIVGLASTAVDRMALYLIPIQLVVFARLGILMSHKTSMKTVNIGIITYYSIVLFIWLNFATYAYLWLPYQNILFQGIF